jgi:hypothetical protein
VLNHGSELSLPDIMCCVRTAMGVKCLLSIQVRTRKLRPSTRKKDTESIFAMVSNVSHPHFFTRCPTSRTEHEKQSIALAFPTAIDNKLYGTLPTEKLCQLVKENPWNREQTNIKWDDSAYKEFEEIATLEINTDELSLKQEELNC